MFSIISNHIFSDGNKRTGLTAALVYLAANGYKLKSELNTIPDLPETIFSADYDSDLEQFTLYVASGKTTLVVCQT